MYENFIAEAFIKQGLGLFYCKKENGTLEEAFFVRSKDELILIEVKPNSNKSKSLSSLIENEKCKGIKHGIKFGDLNVGYPKTIYTFPYFYAFLTKKFLNEWDNIKRQ